MIGIEFCVLPFGDAYVTTPVSQASGHQVVSCQRVLSIPVNSMLPCAQWNHLHNAIGVP